MLYTWKGISDEVFTCGLCGRNNLKKTIILEGENGEIEYFGSECVKKVLGWTQKQLKEEIKREENKQKKEKEQILKTAKFQYNKHPNVVRINHELIKYRQEGLTVKEMQEKGIFAYWNELKRQAKEEILTRFNLPSDTYL